MSDKLLPFAFEDSLVRVRVDENGNPWFVAKDVCRVLELSNNRDALSSLDDDEKADVGITDVSSNGVEQARSMKIVSESGLYALIFRSRKKEARRIRKWVTSEVLPMIRKTGQYAMPGREIIGKENSAIPRIPEMLRLRPTMRQRLWNDAMQAARLDNVGSEAARTWFVELCRMMVARPVGGADEWLLVQEFMEERLEATRGHDESFGRIYSGLRDWWLARELDAPLPGAKIVSMILRERFRHIKSSVSTFKNCRLKEALQ
jgi:prophage antirepressor-like protein